MTAVREGELDSWTSTCNFDPQLYPIGYPSLPHPVSTPATPSVAFSSPGLVEEYLLTLPPLP